jgi:hypothetical protein
MRKAGQKRPGIFALEVQGLSFLRGLHQRKGALLVQTKDKALG